MRVHSFTERPDFTLDPDTPEGREGIEEAKHKLKLDAHSWLPFAAKTYQLPGDIEDYIIAVTPMLPSTIPNRNGIAFPLEELVKFQPPPVARMVYKAWAGCPLHVEHQNEDYRTAIGVVLDTSLQPIRGFNQGKIWKIMSLVAVSKTKGGTIAQRVGSGQLNTFSMGADAGYFTCGYCGQEMQRYNHCQHLNPERPMDWGVVRGPDGRQHLIFRNAHNIVPVEFSVVETPAWVPATGELFSGGLP